MVNKQTNKKKPTAKAILDSINKIKVVFSVDIPEHEIKNGDVKEFTETDAIRIVKSGIASFYDKEIETKLDEEESIKYISKTFFDKKDLAHNFLDVHPHFFDRSGLFWAWDKRNKLWKIVDETDILNKIDRACPDNNIDTIQSKHKQEVLEAIKRAGRERIPQPMKKTWVQFSDKIIDIKTGEVFNATSKYNITNPIPWKIGETEETPTMDRIFEEWVGEKYVKTLYEIIAYCTLPDYPIHRIFCFVGRGLNGKSKYLELIIRFVGNQNAASVELDRLLNSRFEVSKIYKKLICTMGETNYNNIRNTSLLKLLTGQDQIGYEFKNKNPFDDYNYAKILMSTNSLPMTEDKTAGFYRRWLIINFSRTFTEKKNILEDIPDVEYENLAKKTIGILKDLLERREFTNDGDIDEKSKRYEDISNPLQKFLEEYTDTGMDGKIYKWEFKERFLAWMIKRGYRQWSDREISIELRKMGFTDRRESDENRWRYWEGISWKKDIKNNEKTAQTSLTASILDREIDSSPNIAQDVHGGPTQSLYVELSRGVLDILDKLDKWKHSNERKSSLHIDFIKNVYKMTEKEVEKLKNDGMIMEVTPKKYRIV